MHQCGKLGNCILSNHGLNGRAQLKAPEKQLYIIMQNIAKLYQTNIDFQTVSPKLLTPWCDVIESAIAYNGKSIELWPGPPGGFTSLSPDELQVLSVAFAQKNQSLCAK
jgi:hypothetical protein